MKTVCLWIILVLLLFIFTYSCNNNGDVVTIELSGISLSEGTLTPIFDADTTVYTADVPNETDSITVTVTVNSESDLEVSINGNSVLPGTGKATIDLDVGDNEITIVVSYGGESETYLVTVTRAGLPEIRITGPVDYYDYTYSGGEIQDIVSGSTIDFWATFGDGDYTEMTFTIENAGGGDLTLLGTAPDYIDFSGTDPNFFDVSTPPTEAVIPPGMTETFTLRFTGDASASPKNAIAAIENNDGDEGTFTLSLTGYAS